MSTPSTITAISPKQLRPANWNQILDLHKWFIDLSNNAVGARRNGIRSMVMLTVETTAFSIDRADQWIRFLVPSKMKLRYGSERGIKDCKRCYHLQQLCI
jgi:hypothetical protein